MIPSDKIKGLLQQLLARSRADEVRWNKEKSVYGYGAHQTWYQLRFPNSLIRIGYVSPETEPDYYEIRVESADGHQVLGTVTAFADEDGSEWYTLLEAAFDEAERHVTGWDRALAELEDAISSSGPIGLDPPNASTDNDVPF